jgi:hypothetical protein
MPPKRYLTREEKLLSERQRKSKARQPKTSQQLQLTSFFQPQGQWQSETQWQTDEWQSQIHQHSQSTSQTDKASTSQEYGSRSLLSSQTTTLTSSQPRSFKHYRPQPLNTSSYTTDPSIGISIDDTLPRLPRTLPPMPLPPLKQRQPTQAPRPPLNYPVPRPSNHPSTPYRPHFPDPDLLYDDDIHASAEGSGSGTAADTHTEHQRVQQVKHMLFSTQPTPQVANGSGSGSHSGHDTNTNMITQSTQYDHVNDYGIRMDTQTLIQQQEIVLSDIRLELDTSLNKNKNIETCDSL